MTKTKYGFLSDMHRVSADVPTIAAKVLKEQGADALIYNGDLVGDQLGVNKQTYFAVILEAGLKTGLPVFVQPGSHEEVRDVVPVISDLSSKYSNLVSALRDPKHEAKGHHVVFLPGSDFRAGGQFALDSFDKRTSGMHYNYVMRKHSEIEPIEGEQLRKVMDHPEASKALLHFTDIDTLDTLVTDPGKTIVVCHVPRKFDSVEHGVDHGGRRVLLEGSGLMPGIMVESQIRQQVPNATSEQLQQIANANGFVFKRENRGNGELTAAYARNGITKATTGHFHESVHRATGASGNPLAESTPSKEHFWMASYMDEGLVGMLTVDNDTAEVSHKNINLRDHMN